jgi:ubiquinone/menaquinone biosynthesis C-methylase UbiE
MSDAGRSGWRDFWKHDFPSSCVPDNPATADAIAATWRGWLEGFPDGSRFLDIATGNGIVLAHAAAAARAAGRRFELTGIDLAEIDPPRYVTSLDPDLAPARFLGRVAAETLPFDDASFDVVVSQHGLEYAGLDRALDEVARVLVPGGALVWLAHAESSSVVRQNRSQALEVDYVLSPEGLVHAMKKFVARARRGKDMGYSAKMLDESFARAEAFCRVNPPAHLARELCADFARVAGRWQSYRAGELEAMLEETERRLADHRDRIESLLAAIMTPARIERVRARLAAPPWEGLTIGEVLVGAAQSPIGLRIGARLAAAGGGP